MKFSSLTTLSFAAFLATTSTTAQDTNTTTDAGEEGSAVPAETTAPAETLAPACTSSDECGEGFFCSSSSGACTQLTCQNWAAGVPAGETSYSEAPCAAENPDGAPGDYFCGWDGNCYKYKCQDWYMYGPVEFTSYDPGNPVELVCSDYDTGEADRMNSIVFGCRPYQPGSKAPEALNWVHYFNQECKATPRGSDDFKCYQNKDNTDYNDFQAEAARLNPPSCDRDVYGGLTEQNLFWYQIVLRQIRKGDTTNYKQGRDNTINTFSFDPSEADKTMFAVLESDEDVPPPNTFPPATTPDTPSGAVPVTTPSFLVVGLGSVVAAAGVFFL